MRTYIIKTVIAISFSFFLSVNLFASSVEICGTYTAGHDFEADTLLVTGDCYFTALTLEPGTFIQFKGDYTIEMEYVKSIGALADSITFCGSDLSDETIKQGTVLDLHTNIWQSPPSEFRLTRLMNLKEVYLNYAENCSFSECNSVWLKSSNLSKIVRNNSVTFDHKIDSSEVVGNEVLYFTYDPNPHSSLLEFSCTHTTFRQNSSGLRNHGNQGGQLYIENCRFIENSGPILKYDASGASYDPRYTGIKNNKFYHNTGDILDIKGGEGILSVSITHNEFVGNYGVPVACEKSTLLSIINNLFAKNRTSSGPGSVYYYNDGDDKPVKVQNNTFVANSGETFGSIEIVSETTCPFDLIANNIFWDNTATQSDYAIGIEFLSSPSGDCELNISNSVAQDTTKLASISGTDLALIQQNSFSFFPEFVDTLNNNFRLSMVSPYIDAGSGEAGEEDLAGNPRIFGKAIDIGAYEYLPKSNPGLIYQSGDTNVFIGDTLRLKIQTDDRYNYSWFHNDSEIEGLKDPLLLIDNAVLADTGEYKVKISSMTESIWSTPMHVGVYPTSRKWVLPDSLVLCPDSIEISIEGKGNDFLWSTGNTTSAITVKEPGTYWVQFTDSLGLFIRDTVEVYHQSSIEISGDYLGPMEFCADTLLVVGDCYFRGVTINPGTFVLFKGDYSIDMEYVKSFGTQADSITFCGSDPSDETIRQGTILDVSTNIWQSPPSFFRQTNMVNLKDVSVSYAEQCTFSGNNVVRIHSSKLNKIIRNSGVNFYRSIDSCEVIGNEGMFFTFRPDNASSLMTFRCTNTIFRKNLSGLTHFSSGGLLTIENCQFIENAGPILNYEATRESSQIRSAFISRNRFYKNTGDILVITGDEDILTVVISANEFIENNGLAISSNNTTNLTVDNNLFVKNRTGSGPGLIYYSNDGDDKPVTIRNNTFVANHGQTFSCVEINSVATCPVNKIANNIFWGNSDMESGYAIGINFTSPPTGVCDLNLTNHAVQDTNKLAIVNGADLELKQRNSFNYPPEFVDTLNNNFRLSKVSPYIDAGSGETRAEDLDGNPRIFGKAIDLGAYEYIPSGYPTFLSFTNDTNACQSDSVSLKAIADDRYIYNWYKDGVHLEGEQDETLVLPLLTANDTGYFQASINNLTDTVWSDPIHLTYSLPPLITDYTPRVEVCPNQEAFFSLEAESDYPLHFEWISYEKGELGMDTCVLHLESVQQRDTLLAIATSVCGSDSTGEILAHVFPEPSPDLGNDTTLVQGENILLDAGDYESFLWNTGDTERAFRSFGGDTLIVTVTDTNSCSGSDTIIINLSPVSLEGPLTLSDLKLYPNPVSDVLHLDAGSEISLPYRIMIYSQQGSLITTISVEEEGLRTIEVEGRLHPGYYFLQVQSETHTGLGRFVVK